MIQSTVLLIVGYHMIVNSNGDKLASIFGYVLLFIGAVCGEVIEEKTFSRIRELERKQKNETLD